MYRLFGNAPVGRSDETQMSADRMAIENRKKAREKFEKHQKRRKAPNHESACRRKGRSQRQKWSPGLCMAGANSYCTVALDASQRRVAWGMKRGKITESGGGKQ